MESVTLSGLFQLFLGFEVKIISLTFKFSIAATLFKFREITETELQRIF